MYIHTLFNYFYSHEPTQWHRNTNIHIYSRYKYRNLFIETNMQSGIYLNIPKA